MQTRTRQHDVRVRFVYRYAFKGYAGDIPKDKVGAIQGRSQGVVFVSTDNLLTFKFLNEYGYDKGALIDHHDALPKR